MANAIAKTDTRNGTARTMGFMMCPPVLKWPRWHDITPARKRTTFPHGFKTPRIKAEEKKGKASRHRSRGSPVPVFIRGVCYPWGFLGMTVDADVIGRPACRGPPVPQEGELAPAESGHIGAFWILWGRRVFSASRRLRGGATDARCDGFVNSSPPHPPWVRFASAVHPDYTADRFASWTA